MSSSLAKRLIKSAGKDSTAALLKDADNFDKKVICSTGVPIVDIMWSRRS